MQQLGINNEIEAYIKARIELGAKKYGQTIYVDDKRDFLQEALEEALDMSVYLAGELIKLKKLKEKLMTTEQDIIFDNQYQECSSMFEDTIENLSDELEIPKNRIEALMIAYLEERQK
tara:strand:- start:618 stop:971 length:354 start_codon:yes stop_codon:yes gene_type:complete